MALQWMSGVCATVAVGIRDNRLIHYDRQIRLARPSANTMDLWEAAVELFQRHHTDGSPVRSLSVKASGLSLVEGME